MTGKFSKKGRNPQLVDNWLDSIDLYRKSVAYDETCLFRAISEQVSHSHIRKVIPTSVLLYSCLIAKYTMNVYAMNA